MPLVSGHAKDLNVAFILPDKQGPLFWQLVMEITQHASDDLDINVKFYYSDSDRFATDKMLRSILNKDQEFDYIIFRPFKGNVKRAFNLLEENKVNFVTIENAMSKEESSSLGEPRGKYQHWIGEVKYDNFQGGKLLLAELINAYKQNNDKSPNVIGIGGDFDSVSLLRQKSLEMLREEPQTEVNLLQIFPMQWNPNLVSARMSQITKRYPNADIFWVAGDQMAYEVVKFLEGTDKQYYIGGFDWLPETLIKIKSGRMTASVGGHLLLGAQAIVKVHEHFNGIRHRHSEGLFQYEAINIDNVDEFIEFFENKRWRKLDFNRFSHVNNDNAEKLSVANLMD